jgi:SAM-dependent methyltransferase
VASHDFEQQLKRNVAENFDQSYQLYQAFEDKYHLFETLALALAAFIEISHGADVLDVGCGNGISARALCDTYGCRVLGLDLSEKMVAAGRLLCQTDKIRLVVGDGERLGSIVDRRTFDCIVYNASIFIFHDVERSIREASACLISNGSIGFSFYPDLQDGNGEDLLPRLFERIREPMPKFRVIADYHRACLALERYCGPVRHHRWQMPLDERFLEDFFSIPAQSASLFPGRDLSTRQALVIRLFSDMAAIATQGSIVWRLAAARKP